MGQLPHAAFYFLYKGFYFLYKGWSCHPRQLRGEESRQTRLARLRAHLAGECHYALCAGEAEWLREYAGSADWRYSGRRV